MSLLRKKMLLAPILAVALAFSLVGVTSYFPQSGQPSQSPLPQPTQTPASALYTAQPMPTSSSIPSTAPPAEPFTSPAPSSLTAESSSLIPLLSAAAIIVVAIIAALLFFSEKDSKLER